MTCLYFLCYLMLSWCMGVLTGLSSCTYAQIIPASEVEALSSLYNRTGGPLWKRQQGWNLSQNPCSWYGVICMPVTAVAIGLGSENNTGDRYIDFEWHVTSLFLYDNNLVGLLDEDILSGLTLLQTLDLSNNPGLYGSLPSLSSLSELLRVDLSGCSFTGPLMPQHFLPSSNNLTILDLSRNSLTGSSVDFNRWADLEELFLYQNQFQGMPVLDNLHKLRNLDLARNPLNGQLTLDSFRNNTKLQSIRLPLTGLTGVVPHFIQHHELQELVLSYNDLTGELPSSWLSWSKLQKLDVRSNHLIGGLPATAFAAHPNLTAISLSFNSFSGPLPSFVNNSRLREVSLTCNTFDTDPVPTFAPKLSNPAISIDCYDAKTPPCQQCPHGGGGGGVDGGSNSRLPLWSVIAVCVGGVSLLVGLFLCINRTYLKFRSDARDHEQRLLDIRGIHINNQN